MKRHWFASKQRIAGAALLLGLILAGCDALPDERRKPFEYDFGPPIVYDGRHAIVFFIDGVNNDTFNRLVSEGKLPNIKKFFIDRGVRVRRAVTTVPSLTYSVMAAFLTGLGPGHNGVPALEWFDRHQLEYRWYSSARRKYLIDLDYREPNIYQVLHDQFTAAILTQLTRGATQYIENWYTVGPAYFFRFYNLMDRICIIRFEEINKLARLRRQYPRFTIIHLGGTDSTGHVWSCEDPRYRQSLIHVDAQLGRLLTNMQNQGVLKNLCIVLVSDHGHSPTPPRRGIDLVKLLKRRWGIAASGRLDTFGKSEYKRARLFEPLEMIVSHSGERQAFVYVRKPATDTQGKHPWRLRPGFGELTRYPSPRGGKIDLPSELARLDQVDVAALRDDDGSVVVVTDRGRARIERQITVEGKRYSYKVMAGNDPFGYDTDPAAGKLARGAFHDDRQWLAATASTDYPDAVVGLAELFDSPRCGDIALFARRGFQFGRSNRSGHGGLNPRDMLVPLIIAGPGIRHGEIPHARTVDLFPTLLEYLGFADRLRALGARDGRSLWPQIRSDEADR